MRLGPKTWDCGNRASIPRRLFGDETDDEAFGFIAATLAPSSRLLSANRNASRILRIFCGSLAASFIGASGLRRAELFRVEDPAAFDHTPNGLGVADVFERIGLE